MRILLASRNETIHDRLTDRWTRDGHDVVVCADEMGDPCRGVRTPDECPLQSHVDLAVLVSTSSTPSGLAEMGFVCAQRHRVATVTIDPVLAADELWHLESERSSAQRRLEAEDAQAVRERLLDATTVTVHRGPRRVAVEVRVSTPLADGKERLAVADRVRQAIRARDAYVDVIDVSVSSADDEESP